MSDRTKQSPALAVRCPVGFCGKGPGIGCTTALGVPMPPHRARADAAFMKVWLRLADEGVCDAPGGAEQQRVMDEWDSAGWPEIEPFIRERANIGPDYDA